MTMALAMICKDGILIATDGKVSRASISYREVARIWQKTHKVFHVPPHTLVAGAGEFEMIHDVVNRLNAAPEADRAKGLDGLLAHAQAQIVEQRAEAVTRMRAIYGDDGVAQAPRAYFLFAESTPKPRLVYMAEDGEVEDQTHLGYGCIGVGDLIVHIRMQPYDVTKLGVEQAAVLAFGMIKDTIDSGTFRVSDPVQVWSAALGSSPVEWDAARMAKLEERYHAFRGSVNSLLEKA